MPKLWCLNWLDADVHGKGVMYRAVKKMIALGFEHYDLDKIKLNGKIMDMNLYAILKRDWEERFSKSS